MKVDFPDKMQMHAILIKNVQDRDPLAVDYIDWDAFDGVMDALMGADEFPTQDMFLQVFKSSVSKALSRMYADRPMKPTH